MKEYIDVTVYLLLVIGFQPIWYKLKHLFFLYSIFLNKINSNFESQTTAFWYYLNKNNYEKNITPFYLFADVNVFKQII